MVAMLTKEAIAYFETPAKLAEALGIRPPSIYDWGDTVPPLRQLQLERITGGKLKAAPDVFGPPAPAQSPAASA